MGNEMVKGRLGSISRMSPEAWRAYRTQVTDPMSLEISGGLAYCSVGSTLYAGVGYPVSELAPLLDVADMADAWPMIEAARLPKSAETTVAGFIKTRIQAEEALKAFEEVKQWTADHDYIDDFDSIDLPLAFLRELNKKGGLAAVYMAGYYAAEGR